MTWEEKLMRRKKDEDNGKREPLVPANIINGGAFHMDNRMSREEFKKKYNKYGLFGMFDRSWKSSGVHTPHMQPIEDMDEMEALNLILSKEIS